MSFPKHTEYKDSGVVWLDDVPCHWIVNSVKHVIDFTTGWTPPTGNDSYYEGDHLWANISDLGERTLYDTAKRISDSAIEASRMVVSPAGSLMFSFKLSIGAVSFAGTDMYTNEAIATFLPSEHVDLGFAYYAFPKFIVRNAAENIYGAKLLNQELIRSARLPVPPFDEQKAISSFLDVETSKIDGLVSEQRRLIELLKEKRQAVISHAVTKGLNPNAPMKPSGIQWLGDVPQHWVNCSLRRYATFVDGDRGSKYPNENDLTNEGVLFLSSKNIVGGRLELKDAKYISRDKFGALNRGKALDGDLIVKVRGSTGRIGELAIFDVDEYGFETAFINAQMMIIRTSAQLLPKYLSHVSQSFYWMEQLAVGAYGTAQQQLSNSVFSNLHVAIPPMSEQATIADFLKSQVGEFDTLQAEAERAIELLQERRTALISAAVTGKIDVREFAHQGAIA